MLTSIPANKLVEFRAKVAELTVAPETQVPDGQDGVIAYIINNAPAYPAVVPLVAKMTKKVLFEGNDLPAIENAAKDLSNAKGIAARTIQIFIGADNEDLDPIPVEKLEWFSAHLSTLVTNGVMKSATKDAVVGLTNVQVSWAIHHLGDTVAVSLVSQNKP